MHIFGVFFLCLSHCLNISVVYIYDLEKNPVFGNTQRHRVLNWNGGTHYEIR